MTVKEFFKRYWVGILFALDGIVGGAITVGRSHNNFTIFADEFHNLLAGVDMYVIHRTVHFDVFRYSPTFALLFAPFAVTPVAVGMIGWSLLNVMVLYYAVRRLLPSQQANVALLLVALDVNNAVQNMQSNALIAGCMVLAFVYYEMEKPWRGAMAVAGGTLIKIFPISTALFGLLHPPRGAWGRTRVIGTLVVVGLATVLLPLPFTGPTGLLHQYQYWFASETTHIMKTEYSFMSFLEAWFDWYGKWWHVQALGLLALLLPIALKRATWDDALFRRTVLGSVLCFVVLFNHRAESASYVIAMTGIAVWWAGGRRRSYQNIVMLLAFALIALPHDFSPASWRTVWLNPGRIRTLATFIAWATMEAELFLWKKSAGTPAPAGASGGPEVRQQDIAAA